MRLAVLGPSGNCSNLFREQAEFALCSLQPDRVIYLGNEDFVDDVMVNWAAELVGQPASDNGIWQRAARDCADASAEQIDAFLHKERQLEQLRKIQFLRDAGVKVLELMDRLVVTLVFDKAVLTEEDLFSSSVFVFGQSARPMIRTIGARVFLSPGPMGHEQGGLLLLHQRDEKHIASWYGCKGTLTHEAPVVTTVVRAKLSVQGVRQ